MKGIKYCCISNMLSNNRIINFAESLEIKSYFYQQNFLIGKKMTFLAKAFPSSFYVKILGKRKAKKKISITVIFYVFDTLYDKYSISIYVYN